MPLFFEVHQMMLEDEDYNESVEKHYPFPDGECGICGCLHSR